MGLKQTIGRSGTIMNIALTLYGAGQPALAGTEKALQQQYRDLARTTQVRPEDTARLLRAATRAKADAEHTAALTKKDVKKLR